MKVFTSVADWRCFRPSLADESIGLVPTMGALHAGHQSLVRRSRQDNAFTVVSIYVNPAQFDQASDLEAYPAQIEQDLQCLQAAGVDAVLMPASGELYPDHYRYRVVETDLSRRLCGAHRPGHFDGVLTVVLKLFNIIRPHRAYFGEKDYQQLQLVRGMVDALFLDIDIVPCPTVREADGLAMSSRNQRLEAGQREQAAGLFRALQREETAPAVGQELERQGFVVDYVEDFDGRRLAAARLGAIRLIDNVPLTDPVPLTDNRWLTDSGPHD